MALREDTQYVKTDIVTLDHNTNSTMMGLQVQLTDVKGDTQYIKTDVKSLRGNTHSALQDLNTTLNQGTDSTRMDLATLREETNSALQDLKADLVTLRQEGSQERAEVNATVNKIQETVEEDNLIINSVSNASQKHQQFTIKQFSNITEDIRNIQQRLANQCETSDPVTECDPLISVQYLPTSCSQLATSSPSGYYWIYNYDSEVRVYCDFSITSRQLPAPSCELIIATYYLSIPSGYYWVESSNGSAANVYCDNHLTTPEDPSHSCQDIVNMHPSTPSGYYWVRSSNGSAVKVYCDNHLTSPEDPSHSCQDIVNMHPSTPSGYYWVESSNGSAVNVYCDNHLTSPEDHSHSCQDIVNMHPSTPSGYYWVRSSNGSAVNVYCYSQQDPATSCQYIAEMHPSTPSGYYWVRSSNGSAVNVYCYSQQDPATSCQYIAEMHPSTPSGYYWVESSNGSAVNVYCDMARHCCGSTGGWVRVAYLDMTDTRQQCPGGFRLITEPKRTCELIDECTSMFYRSRHIHYSKVCGRVRAYQYGPTLAFTRHYQYGASIDSNYVAGMSITHGKSPRKHIWTFAAALDEIRSSQQVCPCTKIDTPHTGHVPPFIGNDYFCDTGSREQWDRRYYWEDPLWDGEGCGPTSSCCQFNSPPWFCKELRQPTTDDVEVRVCRYDRYYPRNIPFDTIELYVQ